MDNEMPQPDEFDVDKSHDETSPAPNREEPAEPAQEEFANVEGDLSELDMQIMKVAELEEQLARRNADLYNLRQEYNGYVKRSKVDGLAQRDLGISKVLETLMSVLDDAYLAREHGDLIGAAGTIVEKLEQTLKTNFQLERFGKVGDIFDPQLHEALMSQASAEVESEQISQLIQPGYRQGEKILRPARVGVVTPE